MSTSKTKHTKTYSYDKANILNKIINSTSFKSTTLKLNKIPSGIINSNLTPQTGFPSPKYRPLSANNKQRQQAILPKMHNKHLGMKTLVLDLDETLVHSSFEVVDNPDYIVNIKNEEDHLNIYVLMRPHMKEFLEVMSKYYEVVIFTASMSDVSLLIYSL